MPSWFKADDNMKENRKFVEMEEGKTRIDTRDVARLYYMDVLAYCSHNLTDGFITEAKLVELAPGVPRSARLLVSILTGNRLLLAVKEGEFSDTAPAGYVVPDYLDWNRSRAQVLAERARTAERVGRFRAARRGRDPGGGQDRPDPSRNGVTPNSRNAVTPAVTGPASNGVTNGVTSDAVTPLVTADRDRYRERTNSSRDDDSPKRRASENSSSSNEAASEWKFDGPLSEWKPDPYNPRCVDHAKVPIGVRGPRCGVCARTAAWAREELAKTRKRSGGHSGDEKRNQVDEWFDRKLGTQALQIENPQLRVINGGHHE